MTRGNESAEWGGAQGLGARVGSVNGSAQACARRSLAREPNYQRLTDAAPVASIPPSEHRQAPAGDTHALMHNPERFLG